MRLRSNGFAESVGRIGDRAGGVHPYCELLCILEGEADLEWSGVTYKADGIALFVILPNSPHQLVQRSHSLRYWYAEFHTEDTDPLPAVDVIYKWNGLQGAIDWTAAPYPALTAAFGAVGMLMQAEDALPWDRFEDALLSDLRKLLILIGSGAAARQPAPSRSSGEALAAEVLRFLESVFPQPITLQTIADYTHYDPSYLVRLFKQQTGKTPFAYLNELRLNAAAEYLLHSEMSVQQVSQACGFQSIHYFSRSFKQRFGSAPSEWRRDRRGQEPALGDR
ncbi:helix-turn-helix transcriptional regulator [Paenibacillus sacheonensis]|uniref:Helix-turn-helix domain-containing protein n=1 Tax=Paenibacillus sacheonensis TaxID=742054 RepID=A0A7X5C1M0_9BACL|nr:helix-turn-helix domain-containing protein [Paenibacillus sacheonensis]MBM7567282.1 AraC-like DNA-binding protein [Paenibacillus sacheonensis]NBC72826.1 helix-turn-helix domain-containing protein [Paenibacillus sacheonensis]